MAYKYNFHTMRKRVLAHFQTHHLDLQMHVTSKLLKDAGIFVSGFLACLKVMGEEPMNESEIDELIFREVVEYVKITIESGLVHA